MGKKSEPNELENSKYSTFCQALKKKVISVYEGLWGKKGISEAINFLKITSAFVRKVHTAFRLRMQSNLQRFPSTTGRFRKISGLNLKSRNQDFKKLKQI